MFIVNEDGTAMVNTDQVFAIATGVNNVNGEAVLLAQSATLTIALASGGDRPKRAAEAIMKAHKERRHILDLNDLLGAKPDITIPTPGSIILPHGNGEGRPS
jgi:hypothetical protein